jgi:hypothetical protein
MLFSALLLGKSSTRHYGVLTAQNTEPGQLSEVEGAHSGQHVHLPVVIIFENQLVYRAFSSLVLININFCSSTRQT